MEPVIPEDRLSLARRLAEEARAYLIDAFPRRGEVEIKPDGTPVTPFDKGLEEKLRASIARAVPGDGILGEEYGPERTDAEFVWVLDPIDGTKAFLTGKPTFGSLIALARDQRPVLGVIECPLARESWVGGDGVPTTRNGEPVRVREPRDLADCFMYSHNTHGQGDGTRAAMDRLRGAVRFTVHDSDCFGYGRLATGDIDLVVEPGLAVHDHAALGPVVRGAGGIFEDVHGRELTILTGADSLAATSRRVADAARAVFAASS